MTVELFNNENLNNVTKKFMNSQGILASILLPVGGLDEDNAFTRSVFKSSLMSTLLDCRTLEWLWPMPDDSLLLIVTVTRLCFVTDLWYTVYELKSLSQIMWSILSLLLFLINFTFCISIDVGMFLYIPGVASLSGT